MLFKFNISIFLILVLILGIFSDIKKNFSPKFRIIFQLFIIIALVFVNKEILINKTNIEFLDLILQNQIAKFIFSAFCIITLLNGFNFMDGVNGLVSGYILSILIVLSLIMFQSSNLFYYSDMIFIFAVFFLFNIFGKSFFGDNGIYISSILVAFLVINIININQKISPIIAISLLWYPAIENLFTIIRRLFKKKLTYLPDKLHLHSLVFRKLHLTFKFIPENYKNTLTGLIINIFLIPNFIFTYLFYDKSYYLGSMVIVYIFVYLISYSLLYRNISKI
tara:strand:+ start:45 stop:881 length:837 start_codon:yes stop_codon:yes gene_type:complete